MCIRGRRLETPKVNRTLDTVNEGHSWVIITLVSCIERKFWDNNVNLKLPFRYPLESIRRWARASFLNVVTQCFLKVSDSMSAERNCLISNTSFVYTILFILGWRVGRIDSCIQYSYVHDINFRLQRCNYSKLLHSKFVIFKKRGKMFATRVSCWRLGSTYVYSLYR